MTILYLHGMASSHACPIAQSIQRFLPASRVIVPDLSIDPAIAFPQIDQILKEEKIDLIIGHSLGGFMAQKYRGYKKILINPSLGMSYMYLFRGDNRYKQPRKDGKGIWHVTTRMCQQYKEMEASEYENLTEAEDNLTKGCFGRSDLFTRLSAHRFKKHYSHRIMMPGGHYPTAETVRDYIIPTIRTMQRIIEATETGKQVPFSSLLEQIPQSLCDSNSIHVDRQSNRFLDSHNSEERHVDHLFQ